MLDSSERLRELRKERHLTIKAVSEGADIPIRTYQNYEYGLREISAEALYKLADFYGVTTDYLLGREIPLEVRLNAKYQSLSQTGKEAVSTIINVLANSKEDCTSSGKVYALTAISEVLATIVVELNPQKINKT